MTEKNTTKNLKKRIDFIKKVTGIVKTNEIIRLCISYTYNSMSNSRDWRDENYEDEAKN